MKRPHRSRLAVVAAVLAAASVPASAQTLGSLAGTVLDEESGARIEGVKITIIGTGLETVSDEFGQFLLDGLPVGTVSMRIAAAGYVSVVESIEVSATDFLQVRLSPVAAALEELFVTANRARREDVRLRHVDGGRTALDVLADDVPGVIVRRGGGDLGTGAAIAIRGVGTFNNAAPDIYVDGARIDPTDSSRALNTLDLIPADMIARIRVFRGPSAAAPFALAANGVILIETVRGGRQ